MIATRENPFVNFLVARGYAPQSDGFFAKPKADVKYRTNRDTSNYYIQGMVVSQGVFLQTFAHHSNAVFDDTAWHATFQRHNYTV